jgi:hypothetical protein
MRLLRVHCVGAARAGAAGVRAHVCDRPKPPEVQCSTRCVCTPGCCANTTGHITSDERAMEGARPKLGAEGLGLSRAFGFGFKLPAGLDAAAALVERANRQQTLRDLASWAARHCGEALGRRRCVLATRRPPGRSKASSVLGRLSRRHPHEPSSAHLGRPWHRASHKPSHAGSVQ